MNDDPHDADIEKMIAEMVQHAFESGRELGRAEARLEWHLRIRTLAAAPPAERPRAPSPSPATKAPSPRVERVEPHEKSRHHQRRPGELEAEVIAALQRRPMRRGDLDRRFGASVGPVLRRLLAAGRLRKSGRSWAYVERADSAAEPMPPAEPSTSPDPNLETTWRGEDRRSLYDREPLSYAEEGGR